MSFFSTRGKDCATASQAILRGLASDGGLFVPSLFPAFSLEAIGRFVGKSYQEITSRLLRDYLEDFSVPEIDESVKGAYGSQWDSPQIAPLATLNRGTFVLELFHGPTLAFKDIALQMLPRLMRLSAEKNGENREVSIIVATSGDTGKAALEGFKDVPGTSCSVFYPQDGVSDVQKLQMNTTGGSNTHVIGINGNFDDAQTGVKRLFSDASFREKLNAIGRVPSSANSINFGRLVPQIAYYFTSYVRLLEMGAVSLGQSVNFVVPTGNFGDILAGYYAQRMGLPISKLICASNRNNVLTDFFNTGIYHTHRAFFKTMSPSMDILVSSNLERLLYEVSGRDGALTASWMEQLKSCGSFSVGDTRVKELSQLFWAGSADDFQTAESIRRTWERTGYLTDPHTAVAMDVLRSYRMETGDQTVSVVLSTASPYKFAADVLSSLAGREAVKDLDAFAASQKLEELTHVPMPSQVSALRGLPIRHTARCDVDGMEETLLGLLK